MAKIVYAAAKWFFIVVNEGEKVIDSLEVIKDAVEPMQGMENFNVYDNIIHLTIHTADWKKRQELVYGRPGGVVGGGGTFRQAYADFIENIEKDLRDFDEESKYG